MTKAIVTGASGNLGKAVTDFFVQQDFFVHAFISPWDDKPKYPNESVRMYELDLCDEEMVKSHIKKIFENDHSLDMVVNCAGGFSMDDFSNTSSRALEEMLHKNFITAFNVTIHSMAHVKKQGQPCKYIFIGSKQATNPGIGTQFVTYSVLDTKPNRDAMPDANFDKWVNTEELAEIMHFLHTEAGGNIRQNVIEVFNES